MRRLIFAALATAALAQAAWGEAAAPPDFCILSVEEMAGTLAIVDPRGPVAARVPIGLKPHEIEVSPDGRTAYVTQFGIADYDRRLGVPGDRVVAVDLRGARPIGSYVLPPDVRAPHGVKLRPPADREMFTNAETGDTMLVYDVASRSVKRRFALRKGTHNFVFAADGGVLYSYAGAAGVDKLDPRNGAVLAHFSAGFPVRGIYLGDSGRLLVGARDEVVALDPTSLGVVGRWPVPAPGQIGYLTELKDGTIVAPALVPAGGIWILRDGAAPRFVPTGKTALAARAGPDGLLYVSNVEDDHITVLDANGTEVRRLAGLTSPNGLGFGNCPASRNGSAR